MVRPLNLFSDRVDLRAPLQITCRGAPLLMRCLVVFSIRREPPNKNAAFLDGKPVRRASLMGTLGCRFRYQVFKN
jgi:hypothetical protein